MARASGALAGAAIIGGAVLVAAIGRRTGQEAATTAAGSRARVVQIALGQLGSGDSQRYWAGVLAPGQAQPPTSWCAAFALWVLRQAGLTDWTYDANGSWFYQLPQTQNPQPGDLAYIPSLRHLAIVESANPITLVNGAGEGNVVTESGTDRAIEFHSIQPLVDKALAA